MPWDGYSKEIAMKIPFLPRFDPELPMWRLKGTQGKSGKTAAILTIMLFAIALCIGGAMAALQEKGKSYTPHGKLKIPCANCHTTVSWKPIRPYPDFDHKTTRYPLKGMHKRLDCGQCHIKLVFSDVGMQCADCHADIHHRQLGSNCEQCHSDRGWRTVARSVNGHENRFLLSGAHAAVECEGCHTSAAVGLFRGLRTDCAFCHINDYLTARIINHQQAGFSTNCRECHSSDSWILGFNHAASTGFALTGVHARLDCVSCHAGGRFAGTPAACIGCHLQDYNGTTNPNHAQAAFPKDCSICHSSSTWLNATFNHSNTRFPLTGFHVTLQCSDCHSNGQYSTLPITCISCHQANYNSAPSHSSLGYPTDCTICHNATAWTPASFNHGTTSFPLTGAHTSVACNSCHLNGVFAGTPTDCYSCHSALYTSTTNPSHVALAFPHDCSQCHTTSTWSGAVFSHTQFPIYSGAHAGVWTTCGDCHVNSNNYSVFTCINCHTHNLTTTDGQHRGVRNYVYNATSCYSCHPNGTSD
jgi:hypothetical protein